MDKCRAVPGASVDDVLAALASRRRPDLTAASGQLAGRPSSSV
jgi:hypothetical protein